MKVAPYALENVVCAVRGCPAYSARTRKTACEVRVGYCNTHAFEAHTLFDKPETTERKAA